MARTYRRDNRGRFSSTGRASTGRQLAARMVSRGTNRLTRDNAGRITSVGGQGATARGGRLRTAAGNKRATQLARLKGTGGKLRKPMGSRPRVSRAEPLMIGGTLAARSSLKRAKQKLKQNPTAAQRGAVTRANKYAAAARARDTTAKKFGRPASVMRKRPPESPLRWQVKAPKGEDAAPHRAKGSRIRMARTASTIAKPKGLKPGAVTERIMERDRSSIRSINTRIDRATARQKQLARMQKEIDYKRANPIGGKAFRSKTTKALNKQQKKLDKSKATIFSAINIRYKSKLEKAYSRLRQMTAASTSFKGSRVKQRGAAYQRSIFGGSTVKYPRP